MDIQCTYKKPHKGIKSWMKQRRTKWAHVIDGASPSLHSNAPQPLVMGAYIY